MLRQEHRQEISGHSDQQEGRCQLKAGGKGCDQRDTQGECNYYDKGRAHAECSRQESKILPQ